MIKTFELYTAKEYSDKYYKDDKFFNYDEILHRLNNFYDTDFPYGLKNIPNKLILYRLLNVDSINDINKKELGRSYVGDKDMFDDEDFLYSASILSGNDPIKTWYIVTIETTPDNLDIDTMLGNRAEYPTEYEFTLKSSVNLKIIDIEEFDNSFYK